MPQRRSERLEVAPNRLIWTNDTALGHCETLTQRDREPWHYLFLLENEPFGRADVSELAAAKTFSLLAALKAQDARGIIPGTGHSANMTLAGTEGVIQPSVEAADEYRTALPACDLMPTAGTFGPAAAVAPSGWVQVRTARRLDRSMFVARVAGQSMEPGVPDGSLCLFRHFPGGVAPTPLQLDGRRIVAQLVRGGEDSGAGSFTLKRMHVVEVDAEGHARIIELLPDNPKAATIRLDGSGSEQEGKEHGARSAPPGCACQAALARAAS